MSCRLGVLQVTGFKRVILNYRVVAMERFCPSFLGIPNFHR